MPAMVTRRLMIERIVQHRPGLEIILMSGCANEVIARQGVLEPGHAMLARPFSMANLLDG
jgi:two-component system, cell cycle sensor histidine kinase and response regulator CckA